MAEREVEVFVVIEGESVLAGRLWCNRRRETESQTFSYEQAFLKNPKAYPLDPALPLASGSAHTSGDQSIFGAFSDCAPDRWGRRLINRAERRRVEKDGTGAPRRFSESDYLLGVRDDLRQGALRFRDPSEGGFLATPDSGVPSLLELPALLAAAENEERHEETDEELTILLRGGSSLGGARPKAHVIDRNSRFAIAKFPSPANDEWDVMRWEGTALELAHGAGIRVPDFSLHSVGGKSVLIVDRFDRTGSGRGRLGYASAMTMLESSDGQQGSYLEIAEVIMRNSSAAGRDLTELWRRAVFSVLISNLDDHLRNHGFLRDSSAGWRLSPAFDLNPDPRPGERHLSTALTFDDTLASVSTLIETASEYRLDENQATHVLIDVKRAVDRWQETARKYGAPENELQLMKPAFEHDAADEAEQIAGCA